MELLGFEVVTRRLLRCQHLPVIYFQSDKLKCVVTESLYVSNKTIEIGSRWNSEGSTNQSLNQSNFYSAQYPWQSQAQWRDGWIGVQQQNRWNSSLASTGRWACRCLSGKGQVKGMCLEMFLEGSNWNCWMDRQQEAILKRRGTRLKSSCVCVGLDPRDQQTIPLLDVSERDGSDEAWSEDKQTVFHAGFCRSTNWS